MPGGGDDGVDRPVGIGIVDDVELGAAHALAKARLVEAARVEPQTGRIDQIGRLGQSPAQSAMRLLHHCRQKLGKYRDRT